MKETALGAQLKARGILPHLVEYRVALAKFINNGGTWKQALMEFSLAFDDVTWSEFLTEASLVYGKRGAGQGSVADDGQVKQAGASPSHDDGKGHFKTADKAILKVPSPSSPQNGTGHFTVADKANSITPRPVSPAYIEAAKAGAKQIALTVLDSFRVRDGRAIGDVLIGELERIRMDNAQEASVIRQIQRHAANAPYDAKVRDIIKVDVLERMIQRGAEVADAA